MAKLPESRERAAAVKVDEETWWISGGSNEGRENALDSSFIYKVNKERESLCTNCSVDKPSLYGWMHSALR